MKITNGTSRLGYICLALICIVTYSTCNLNDDLVNPPPDAGSRCLDFSDFYGDENSDSTCIELNQIITNTTGFPADERADLFGFLDSLNYRVVDSCKCAADLKLWEHRELPADPNIIGVVDGAKKKGRGVGGGHGVSLNYKITLPEGDIVYRKVYAPGNDNTARTPTGSSPDIGVVDAGITLHDALADNLRTSPSPAYCNTGSPDHRFGIDMLADQPDAEPTDFHGHGTFVNGIIAGSAEPPGSIYDDADLTVLNVKATEGTGSTIDFFQAVCGMYYLVEQKVEVINLSWGYLDTVPPMIMLPILEKAADQDIIMIAGIGNDSLNVDGALYFWPAAFASPTINSTFSINSAGEKAMIAVGAYDEGANQLAAFSNWGNVIDISAPGVDIVSTSHQAKDHMAISSGSSFSTAYVSRTLAIMRDIRPGGTLDDLKRCLLESADTVPAIPNSSYEFTLLLNHQQAIECWSGR